MKALRKSVPLIIAAASIIGVILTAQMRTENQINRLDDRLSSRIEGVDIRLNQVVKEVAYVKGLIRSQWEKPEPITAITSEPAKDGAQDALISGLTQSHPDVIAPR